jgi:hypothetical protein
MKIHHSSYLNAQFEKEIHENGYHRRVVKKTTTISRRNRLKRRIFCRSHLHWTVYRDWSRVIFSNETQIVLGPNKKVYVWRKKKRGEMETTLSWNLQ